MSESLHNMATAYVAKGRTAEFDKMVEYVDKLADKIKTMEKAGQRIQKERTGIFTVSSLRDALRKLTGSFQLTCRTCSRCSPSWTTGSCKSRSSSKP